MTRAFVRRSPLLALAVALMALAVFLVHESQPASAQPDCVAPGGARNVKVTAGNAKLTLTWEQPTSWGGWDNEGYRYYIVHWRRADADPELPFNLIDNGRSRRPPTSAYVFSGAYEEELTNPRRFQNHTVVNGTKYDLDVQTAYSTRSCGHVRGQQVQASGTPAETQETPSADATLGGLELANAASGSDAPTDWTGYISEDRLYLAPVLREVDFITVKPTATAGDLATITVRRESGGDPETVASGTASSRIHIAPKADSSVPHNIFVTVTAENGSDTLTYQIKVYQYPPVSFQGVTVEDKAFTEGAEISFLGLGEDEKDALKLPEAPAGFYSGNVTYTAAGLPDGLTMGHDRLIRGTPTAKTDTPATVTYKVTDGIGGSASLTFDVTVAPPVVFDADERQAFKDTILEYTVGQAERIEMTLPEATGGHGTLTYGLSYWVKETRTVDGREITGGVEKSINDDAPGFSFDASTRVLSSDTGTSAPSADAFYSVDYWAEDENGARAIASNSIAVNEAPTIRAIADQSFTVGESVSVTLPAAEGGTTVGIGIRYELEPAVEGLVFNGRQHVRSVTGTPTVIGATEVTYTATDRNNVSASRTFTIEIVAGSGAPASTPAVTAFISTTEGGRHLAFLDWADVSGATGYVVQVIADGGTFPSHKVGALPAEGSLTFYEPRLTWGADKGAQAVIDGPLPAGDYKARVAAENDDGVGPWSNEVAFTVPAGGL